MRTFKLQVNNNQAVLPNVLPQIQVNAILQRKKCGFMHIVAYTNAKPLIRAIRENMDLIKITDSMYIKSANTTIVNEDFTLTTKITNNHNHKAKHYYIDRNTNRVYNEDYLVENRYISKPNENGSQWRKFKSENIILIK